MKKALLLFVVLGIFSAVRSAHAARVNTIGFELATTTAGVEITGTAGNSPTITTSTINTGNYALEENATSTGYGYYCFAAGTTASTTFARAYFYVKTRPSAATDIFDIEQANNGAVLAGALLNVSGTVQAFAGNGTGPTAVGSESSVIATGTWNYLEIEATATVSNTEGITLKLNGTQVGSGSVSNGGSGTNSNACLAFGVNPGGSNNASADLIFDDIAINNNAGVTQNSFTGDGHDVLFLPSGPGDFNQFAQTGNTASGTTNYTLVNDITNMASTAKYVEANRTSTDSYAVASSSTIPFNATINTVDVGYRFIRSATSIPQIQMRIEKAANSTVISSSFLTPAAAANSNTTAIPHNLFSNDLDPYGNPWNPASIATMQIGLQTTNTGTGLTFARVGAEWAYVEYTTTTTAYAHWRAITVDHTKVSSSTGALTNFAVEVSSTLPELQSSSTASGTIQNVNGYDIVFANATTSDATLYNFEQERYVSSTGEIIYWVNIPSISTSTDTTFYMLYANASTTTDQSNRQAVWDSNYLDVYHFRATSTSSGAADLTDSAGSSRTLTSSGITPTASTTNEIDGSVSMTGSNTDLATTAFTCCTQVTMEGWIYDTNHAGSEMYIEKSNVNSSWELFNSGGSLTMRGGGLTNNVVTSTPSAGIWHFIVGTINNANSGKIYIDGKLAITAAVDTPGNTNTALHLGSYDDSNFFLAGSEDEIRISNSVRNADWIATEYNNESSPSTFMTIGPQNPPVTPTSTPVTTLPFNTVILLDW